MKYTDYMPDRTAAKIREDMAMIQTIRPYGYKNRRRTSHYFHFYAITAATFAAVCIFIACRG